MIKFKEYLNEIKLPYGKYPGLLKNLDPEDENLPMKAGFYKTYKDAVLAAKKAHKKSRDPDDTIEIYQHRNGSFELNHSMNSAGRRAIEWSKGIFVSRIGK